MDPKEKAKLIEAIWKAELRMLGLPHLAEGLRVMPAEPVKLICIHCNQIIYDNEEYNLESEHGPTEHVKCGDEHEAKRREEYRQRVWETRQKEQRGEKLSWEEVLLLVNAQQLDNLWEKMFQTSLYMGPGNIKPPGTT